MTTRVSYSLMVANRTINMDELIQSFIGKGDIPAAFSDYILTKPLYRGSSIAVEDAEESVDTIVKST